MRIGELGKIVTGKTPPTKQPEYFGSDYPFITPSDIVDYNVRHLESIERYLSQKWKNDQPKYLIPANAICYVCIGSTVGKICMTQTPSFTNQQINSIICDQDIADPRYLFYKLKYETPQIKSIADGKGAGKAIINKSEFEQLRIDIPPLPLQHKISTLLSAYDDLIENNTRRIKILEEMAQTIYNEWFVKFRFPGHSKVKMVKSEIGEMPEGWLVRRISDIIDVQSGFAFKSGTFVDNGKYGLVTIKNVQDGKFITDCDSRLEDLPSNMPEYCVLKDGDILLSLTGNIGRICLCYGEGYLLNQRVAKLVPKEAVDWVYAYFMYFQPIFRSKLENISTGVAQQNLSPIEMGKIEVVFPSIELRKAYAELCSPMLESILLLNKKNAVLRQTRDLLLPRLISGELDVEGLDIKVDN